MTIEISRFGILSAHKNNKIEIDQPTREKKDAVTFIRSEGHEVVKR